GGRKRRAMQAFRATEIEIGLIDTDHFNEWGELVENCRDTITPLRIFIVMTVEEYCVRTEPAGGSQWHRRVNPELAGFIACGRNNSTLVGTATDNDRFAAKLGSLEQLNGNKKRIHVDVQNGGLGANLLWVDRIVLGAESGQVRHGSSLRPRGYGEKSKVPCAGRQARLRGSCSAQIRNSNE